ncbi:MAG TPA: SDR family NAD(P)-dependent oxidoreductase [Candidatus Baltobacteraceae bacterium]|nr:SDR family NAD(P)-dependent oxidoreductase [Candidatus Baltobacteraceae bacterium]
MSVVLVTGASSGIGRALAIRAARAGYDVVGIGRDRVALDSLAARVRAEHGRIAVAAIDVSDPSNARAIVDLARRAFGRLDVLVNNAGHAAVGPLIAQSDEALRAQFGTHVIGPVAIVREALPLLRAARGHVFMVGSGVARVPVPGMGAYAPSKAALRSATRLLRRELRPHAVAVTYVDPGAVDTAFMSRAGMPGAPAAIMAAPEDVARAILLAFATRPRVLNAVPWQTAFVALGELFPAITDAIIDRNPALVGIQRDDASTSVPVSPPLPAQAASVATPSVAEGARGAGASTQASATATPPESPAANDFDAALEPLRRRMERVKLGVGFVRDLLDPGSVLDVSEVALRWAGMPNKNERSATVEVLEALADAGFLRREGDRYAVVRAAG